MKKERGRCILVCAGQLGDEKIDRREGDFLIAVDGGFGHLIGRGMEPDHILGDFDSLAAKYRPMLEAFRAAHPENITTLPVVKDDTDTMAAVKMAYEKGWRDFLIYGALGGERLDHTLANIQTLVYLKKLGARAVLAGAGTELFVMSEETVCLDPAFEGTFSIFALDPEVRDVTIGGMQYNLDRGILTSSFPLGVSNHVRAGEGAFVRTGTGMALAVLVKE